MDWRALGVGQDDGGRLAGLVGGEQALDGIVVGDLATLPEQQQSEAAPAAVQRHEGLLALATGPDQRRNHHAGREDSLGELGHAIVGRFGVSQVLLGEAQVSQTDLDAGQRRG